MMQCLQSFDAFFINKAIFVFVLVLTAIYFVFKSIFFYNKICNHANTTMILNTFEPHFKSQCCMHFFIFFTKKKQRYAYNQCFDANAR